MKKISSNQHIALSKIFQNHLILVLTTVSISAIISLTIALSIKQNDLDTFISDVSHIVSEMEITKELLSSGNPNSAANAKLIEAFDALAHNFKYVDILVICDTNSTRYYHIDHEKIGLGFIGGDQVNILKNSPPYISESVGTLGRQRRSFHPIMDENDHILGFVMCSVLTSSLSHIKHQIITIFGVLFIILVFIGILLSNAAMYGIKKILLGYHPEEFYNLYVERTEVMDALEEGIIAINNEEKIILTNHAARKLFHLPENQLSEGQLYENVFSDIRLLSTLKTGHAEHNINQFINNQTILSSRIPIFQDDKIIGAALILRDKTEATRLAEELTGTRYMVDTLRAFNHEFMNKLHIILGLLEMNEMDKAKEYILNTSLVSGETVSHISKTVPLPNLAGLLIGKLIRASELGIEFTLKSDSYFREKNIDLPIDCYITLVGNLLENAIDELNSKTFPIKEIELGIYSEEGHTIITCDDTGGGIPEEILFSIYDKNTTTKGEGHGTGYRLIREIIDCYEGTIHIDTELGMGTSIEIILPI